MIKNRSLFSCLAPHAALTYFTYFAFVWAMAWLKRDYMWIAGDDPNLLQQSIQILQGHTPNVDYFSGYPGLSIYIHALVMSVFDPAPFSQHIYFAIQFSILGVIFFYCFKTVFPPVVVLILLAIYWQGGFYNPTPNPGYLFQSFFVAGIKFTYDFLLKKNKAYATMAGLSFGVSFLAKQYGIFGIVAFVLSIILVLDSKKAIRTFIFITILLLCNFLVLLIYFSSLIPDDGRHSLLLKNSFLFTLPSTACLAAWFCSRLNCIKGEIKFSDALAAFGCFCFGFLAVIFVFMLAIYGYENLPGVFKEIMLTAPRRINGYVESVHFSLGTLKSSVLFSLLLAIPILAAKRQTTSRSAGFGFVLSISISFVFLFNTGNNWSTFIVPFSNMVILFIMVTIERGRNLLTKFAVFAGSAPVFLILIPYPNLSYHIGILAYFALLIYPARSNSSLVIFTPTTVTCSVLVVILGYAYATWHSIQDISLSKNFTYRDFKFKSKDDRWSAAIKEATNVEQGSIRCETYACRYLILMDKDSKMHNYVLESK